MRPCTVPDCTRKFFAKGMCYAHYRKMWKYGDPTASYTRSEKRDGENVCGKETCPAAKKIRSHLHYVANRGDYIDRANARPYDEKRKARDRWKDANLAKVRSYVISRKRGLKQATPPWLTSEHWAQMNATYTEARRLTEETGILHHVDHIVPLRGGTVCGLHVPWNLRAIPAQDNMKRQRVWVSE